MITELLLIMFNNLLRFTISLFPNAQTLPTEITSALVTFDSYFDKINSFLPLDTLFVIISLILTFEAGILTFKILNWVLNKLRGSG